MSGNRETKEKNYTIDRIAERSRYKMRVIITRLTLIIPDVGLQRVRFINRFIMQNYYEYRKDERITLHYIPIFI